MNLTFYFSEVKALVKSKSGREIILSSIDEYTIKAETKISVKVPILGKIEKNIALKLTIERIYNNDIQLRYDGGIGTDMIIGGLLTFLSSTPAMKMVEKTQENCIMVHLAEIEQARKILEMITLTTIKFNGDSVIIEGELK